MRKPKKSPSGSKPLALNEETPRQTRQQKRFEEQRQLRNVSRFLTKEEVKAFEKMPRKDRIAFIHQFVDDNGGIETTARIIFPRIPDDDLEGDELIEPAEGSSDKWICPKHFSRREGSKPRNYGTEVVQNKKIGWTCSCPAWRGNRGTDCQHIKRVKRKYRLGTTLFSSARRRPSTLFILPDGSPAEDTLRKRAYAEMPTRGPEMMREAIEDAESRIERAPEETRRGPKSMSLALMVYGLFLKVFHNSTYDQMIALSKDPTLWEYGWTRIRPPQRTSWIEAFGDPDLTEVLWKICPLFPRAVRDIDNGYFLIDATDFGTCMTDNSRDRKFGLPKASYRSDTEQIRHTIAIGDVSSVVYGLKVTTGNGVGSHDGAHLVDILYQLVATAEVVRRLTGDQAYGPLRNFRAMDAVGGELFVRERFLEDRSKGHWPEGAQRVAELEHNEEDFFKDAMARRQKVEAPNSRTKRHNGYQKLRHRVGDPDPKYSGEVELLAKAVAEEKEVLSRLPEYAIKDILDVATQRVGIARLNEALMINIVANIKSVVMMENLTQCRVDFKRDKALPAFDTWDLEAFVEGEAA